jgi:cellulose synthase/poly-beta-1,6-N-acetylglucosamine synthase-like glycosyltransferase
MGEDMLATSGSGKRLRWFALFLFACFVSFSFVLVSFGLVWFGLVWFEAQSQTSLSWGSTLVYSDFYSLMGFTSKKDAKKY